MERVRKISEAYPVFKQIEKASSGQVKGEYCFIGVVVVLFFVLFSKIVASPLTNIFAVLLVLGPTTTIVVGKAMPEQGILKHVLSYLLTFAIFITLDSLVPFIHKKVPFYYHGKLLFFYYLSIRRSQFTEYLNSTVYAPASDLLRKLNEIDAKEKMRSAETAASEKVKELSESIKEMHPSKEE
ncbi:receptor expression-enhancing protein 5/6 [Nematocida sp. AWRm77]|nr:receptor expression-enhancing protein 5/6 [Nematocida sp. AWRm77]